VNLWASFPGLAPQRKARLYTALVERGLASSISGALLPTADPFLYSLALTANEGVSLTALEAALTEAVERLRTNGVTEAEAARARRQLRARLVFESDSVRTSRISSATSRPSPAQGSSQGSRPASTR
jgi:predicted Zn-dependent peptidase